MGASMEHLAEILKRAQTVRAETVPDEPKAAACPLCHGAGYLRRDVPVEDPRFGELVVCECTRRVLDEKRQAMLTEKSRLADLPVFKFDKFHLKFRGGKPPVNSPDAAYYLAREYADKLTAGGLPWLFFFGAKGTGKTHLAAAIGHARVEQGQPAIFMVVPDLLDDLRAHFSPTSENTYDEFFESLRNTPLLILDDLGTQNSTPWAREKLYQLINHRYNRRLPTVITMNEEVEEVDPRLWSRVNDIHLTTRCEVRERDKRTSDEAPNRKGPGRVREQRF